MAFPLIKGRKVRFALVGCGRISKNHFEAIAHHAADAELVDVCDIDPKALEGAVSLTGAKGHSSIADLLDSTSADCVVVATPSGLHSEEVCLIAESGRHAISEKPMATNWTDGLKMVNACDRANVRLFVVKQNRHNKTLSLLKLAIDDGRFGRIYMVSVNVFWTRPQEYYDAAKWRGTWALDGGALMNQASHYVDLLDWLVGPVEGIQAMTATLARSIEAEDTGVLNVRWKNGALGSMSVTMLTYPKNREGSVTILGENGTVKIGGVAVNEVEHWEFVDKADYDAEVSSASYSTKSVYGSGHQIYYGNVIQTLRGLANPSTDGADGLRSLELLVAAYQSARDGTTVTLPLSRSSN